MPLVGQNWSHFEPRWPDGLILIGSRFGFRGHVLLVLTTASMEKLLDDHDDVEMEVKNMQS